MREKTFFRVKEVVSMRKVFETYAKSKGVCAAALNFLLYGEKISFAETPRSLELRDGDQIDVLLAQDGGKPVILLYPLTQLEVTVNLQLSFEWSFSAFYPKPLTKGSPGLDMVVSLFASKPPDAIIVCLPGSQALMNVCSVICIWSSTFMEELR